MHCELAQKGDFICPAVNPENGHCTVFTDEGVVAKERRGVCNYKEIRKPSNEVEHGRIRVGQQKQSKKKGKR